MIDEKLAQDIKTFGVYEESVAVKRKEILNNLGYKFDQKADYVITGGCLPPVGVPHVFEALKNILDYFQVNYTLLSKEYCCGWKLAQPAVIARNETDIAQAKELAKSFILKNFQQAEAMGAKTIALFCAACEPAYSNYKSFTSLEVISFSELIDRHFTGGKLSKQVDYYAGCYRFRRKMTTAPLDLEPTMRVLKKIEGLEVNQLDNNLCCNVPAHMEKLTENIKTETIITICSGCQAKVQQALINRGNYRVTMLPEIVWQSISS